VAAGGKDGDEEYAHKGSNSPSSRVPAPRKNWVEATEFEKGGTTEKETFRKGGEG